MILSLSQAPTKPFEVNNWHETEFEAINGYLETLPQFSIRDFLLQSWKSIVSYYYDERYPNFGVRHSSAPYQESITWVDNESSQHSHISTVNFDTCNKKDTDKAPEDAASNWDSCQQGGSQPNRDRAQPNECLPQRVLSHSHLIFPETTAQAARIRSSDGRQHSDSLEIPSANAPNYALADQGHGNSTLELEENTVDDSMLRSQRPDPALLPVKFRLMPHNIFNAAQLGLPMTLENFDLSQDTFDSQQPDHAVLPISSDIVPHNIFNAAQLGLPMTLENFNLSQDTFDSQQPDHALLPISPDIVPHNIFNAAQLGLPMTLEDFDLSQDTFDSQQPDHALLPISSDIVPHNIFNAAQLGLPMALEDFDLSQDTSSLLAQFVPQNMDDL
ncbi:uncharacterized protein N7515_010212 [Penicillium bovifimosum]|uniref:Uncharacterized protein n=1 Tax=Penicillium bovifimosum TaxID=126998 RepID=A0A9W9GJ63_9EURO|nr:uncharacterized protein N7515_010212 [Penicillium bovifimosum]KAJ5120824.1 hypothetical protein N7515_010212 [Penicillium bovifimosum]